MTAMRGKRACPTSLHQTRTSTSCVMSDPSSFLPITAALDHRHYISSLVLSASDICGDLPPEVDGTVCAGDTILHNKRQQSDVIQSDLNTRKERSLLVAREKAWRCLQILLKPSESMSCSLRLLSMHLLQQNRQW